MQQNQNIDLHLSSKTIILITHKLTNVKNADNIYLLKYGQIIEEGTHKSLINKKGEYYNLWKNQ
ncbi:hypothetical protein [Staphylococcus hominis]|uniref:hypothetical protein n=1 Tax=Staphylococcus hominis TaxID=1290 RepID=UPI002E341914|nr:hypothetical protein [Staphylococcus hominis]